MINMRRVYYPEKPGEHYIILVGRFWPGELSGEKAGYHERVREISISSVS